jgi:heme exporter protein D
VTAMPDHWSYVFAAYAVATVALVGYWRYLSARARALDRVRKKGRQA